MTKNMERSAGIVGDDEADRGDRSLKYGVIAFAIIEALVLIPFLLYMIFR